MHYGLGEEENCPHTAYDADTIKVDKGTVICICDLMNVVRVNGVTIKDCGTTGNYTVNEDTTLEWDMCAD